MTRIIAWSVAVGHARPTARHHEIMTGTTDCKSRWTAASVIIAGILFAGVALRVCLTVGFPNIYHPDEVFQMLEPAHRLVTGWGVVTWEWRAGIRSWLLPGILAGLVSLAGGLDAEPQSYLILITIVLSLASLSIVAIAALAGRRIAGIEGLAIAGAISAGWYDLVYFGSKPLTEPIAANTLVVAVYLATIISVDGMSVSRRRRLLMLLGCLLGLTFWIRFHLALALLFVAGWACRGKVRERWLPLIVGTMIPLSAFGITDWLTWGTPFQSVWKNIWINIGKNVSATAYGTAPFTWYLSGAAGSWALVSIAAVAWIGARKLPLFALVSVIVIASMSIFPHKELRFVLPALALVIVLAGVGTAIIVERLRLLLWPTGPIWLPSSMAILAWLMTSAITATRGSFPKLHGGFHVIQAETYLHQSRDICGLGLLGIHWFYTSGYTRLHRPVPITEFDTATEFVERASSVNWLLLDSSTKTKALGDRVRIAGFTTVQCWDEICVMHREGACTPMNGWDINTQLSARNQ